MPEIVSRFARWRARGPFHALTSGEEQSWCGLRGPPSAVEAPEPERPRICRNCRKALHRGTPWKIDARFKVYMLYTAYDPARGHIPHVTFRPPGLGWLEDRMSSWRLVVRAHSRRQAMYLAANGIKAAGPDEVGITEILEPDPSAWEV